MDHHSLERSSKSEVLRDYFWRPYTPGVSPDGKLSSFNLLLNSLNACGVLEQATPVCEALREAVGRGRTVWGVKNRGGELGWEFYFYDYNPLARTVPLHGVLSRLRGTIDSSLELSPARPYYCFSFERSPENFHAGAKVTEVDIFTGGQIGEAIYAKSHILDDSGTRFKNIYHFFQTAQGLHTIRPTVISSIHLDLSRTDYEQVLWPELVDCETICIADKERCAGIYFGRIRLPQLLFFLRRLQYPRTIIGFVETHSDELDHMLYDVGFDFRMDDGEIRILKSSYYGCL